LQQQNFLMVGHPREPPSYDERERRTVSPNRGPKRKFSLTNPAPRISPLLSPNATHESATIRAWLTRSTRFHFGVGLLVGMTGVGGGSLMTPLLILLFGIHPATRP
jgi:uncharacterized membrane protein YfcA